MPAISRPRDSADVARLRERATRPTLTSAERGERYARHQRDHHGDAAKTIQDTAEREGRALTASENADVQSHYRAHREWSASYEGFKDEARASRERVSVRREPLTYERGAPSSFFADQWGRRMGGNADAEQRLERHTAEMRHELPKLDERLTREYESRTQALGVEYERRVTPQTATGFGAAFAPPLWAIEDWASAPRPERVLSAHFTTFAIPRAPGFSSINLPRVLTGVSTNTQADGQAVSNTDLTDTSASASLVTVAGQADVAIQLLEQSPLGAAHLDMVLWKELTASYDATVESQVWTGNGGAVELNGVLNASIGAVTTSEAIGVKTFGALGETFGYVSDKRRRSPTGWYMRGGRWASLACAEDKEERPLWVPLDNESTEMAQPVGVLVGLPIYLTESVPTTLGTTKNEDCILAGRPEDSYLWESAPTLSLWDETLSSSLEARIVLRAYSAVIHRYPTAYCSLVGWKVEANL
jgi:HK97 family phage major capsid protein